MRKFLIVIIFLLLLFNCYKVDISEEEVLNFGAWSPNMGVHNFSLSEQMEYLDPLIRSGNIEYVRVGWLNNGNGLADWLRGQGIGVLGLFDNEYLRHSNVESIFCDQVTANPEIKYWEIGNEVEYFIGMQPEEYMPIFDKIYKKSKELGVTILSQAPFGNIAGARIFKRMVDLGLDKYPDIIVALHFYGYASKAIHEFAGQIHRLPLGVRVWVTEAGINEFSKHIGFVNQIYPDIVNSLRAERIYWYVFSECGEHSLITNLSSECNGRIRISPLYSQLVGGNVPGGNTAKKIFGLKGRNNNE